MQIHRANKRTPLPYTIHFEMDPLTNFSERIVARSAMMGLSPFDCDRLNMHEETANHYADLGCSLVKDNTAPFDTSLEELREIGGLLFYYYDTTNEELMRIMNNNPTDKTINGVRRAEGALALSMVVKLEKRIRVPRLWMPRQASIIKGFARP